MASTRTVRSLVRGAERRLARFTYGHALERDQWLRVAMYEHVDAFIATLGPSSLTAAEISGSFYQDFGWKAYDQFTYPDFDVCRRDAPPGPYDVVVCDQVLEHVVDPWQALRTLAAMCAPGGHVIVGTPFLIRVHPAPDDYWRFTESGLRLVVEQAGLEPVEVRSWGNRQCVRANFLTWAQRKPWSSMRNEPNFPVNVWVIARKRAEGPR